MVAHICRFTSCLLSLDCSPIGDCSADWIEHVMATGGEPYLKSPEDELSLIVRISLDIYAILAVCCCLLAAAAKATLQLLLNRCRPAFKAWLADGSLPDLSIMPKAKAS